MNDLNEPSTARHEVQYEDMLSLGATLEEMRAYILLRNSGLDPEDKKRIIVDAKGTLDYQKIVSAIQLLGSRFFGEVQNGGNKTNVRTKNYDVNYVDSIEEEAHHVDLEYQPVPEPNEEQVIDVLLAEGDEDALVMQQFEEALIDSLQGDPDIAACLNTYVEARRKLQDKARSRGFWGGGKGHNGFKGKGRGGKNKGGFSQNFGRRRLPLAQRILNSNCALCHQKGHWKAECPNRDRSDGSSKQPSSASAFAGVTMTMIDEGDEYHDPSLPPPEEAFAFMVDTAQDSRHSQMLCRSTPKIWSDNHLLKNQCIRNLVSKGIKRIKWESFREKVHSLNRMTPPHMTDPLIQSEIPESTQNMVEQVFFVSEGSLGIVDLGASLSVIGQSQFRDLCQHLPQSVLKSMKEAPCQVRFRFGNDSSVIGNRAIFFPVGAYWIKVVVVPSNTPFLIANSVFRDLGAVIDTEEATIYFKKLQCRLPIQLSERRLYRLDLVKLLTCCPPQSPKEKAACPEQFACTLSETIPETDNNTDNPLSTQVSHVNVAHKALINSDSTSSVKSHQDAIPPQTEHVESNSLSRSEVPGDQPSKLVSQHGPILEQDLLRPIGRSSESLDGARGRHSRPGENHEDVLRGTQGGEDRLWQGSHGPSLRRIAEGDPLPHMVFPELQTQSKAKPCEVPAFHSASRGAHGEDFQEQAQSRGQTVLQEQDLATGDTGVRRDALPGGRGLRIVGGRQPRGSQQSGDVADAGSHAAAGEPPTSGCRTLESGAEPKSTSSVIADHNMCDLFVADATQQALLLQSLELMNDPSLAIDPEGLAYEGEIIYYCRENNWVAQEMWEYMRSKGVTGHSNRGRQIRSELIEVYCSQESQLTECMKKLNGDAERFGLKQGDLSTRTGRLRLYDRLLLKQPRDIWMSPRCKAWCRWNQFNMSKTPELAQRILQDRREDLVHLLLCDALFQFQQWRHPECHAHLEQPDGSHMIYQSELKAVVEQTFRAKCDMCVAGQLRNPMTGELLRKRTQVLTTSRSMCDMLNYYRCPQEHKHGSIEGTIVTKQFGRLNLSQYTELYTRQFAQRLARCMLSGAQRSEKHDPPDDFVLTGTTPDLAEPEFKRRRMDEKQPPSIAYQKLEKEQQIAKLVDLARGHAPRVGKNWSTDGPIVNMLQSMFPEHLIRGVELCKGADRRRVPPSQLSPDCAPLRMTIGEHRHQNGNFWDDTWETWVGKSRRKLIEKCSPARLLITVFASQKMIPRTENEPSPSNKDNGSEPSAKRHCVSHDDNIENPKIEDQSKTFHGPAFMKLNSDQRQQLIRLHNNLGHPDSQLLGNVLRDQGWDPEAIEGIKDLHCPSCISTNKPRISRPSHLTTPREFNELITIDGIEWTSAQGTQYYFYHILDSGTNFQVAFRSVQRTTTQLIQSLNKFWIQWAGPPQRIMTDSASEFCSEEFSKYLQSQNILSTVIPTEAHWQMGKCERHGAIIQSMLNKFQVNHPIIDSTEFDNALSQIIAAKNSLSRHRGYSPEILVLGKSRHTPACVSNENEEATDWIEPTGTDPEMQWFRDNLHKRETARKAFITADHDQRLRRAYLRRSRPSRGAYLPGDRIMFWREGKGNLPGQWHGPAKVIIQEGENLIWISHMSRLYRCAPEHVRSLSSQEVGNSPSDNTIADDNPDLQNGVFQYHDLTHQSAPGPLEPPSILPENPVTEPVVPPNNPTPPNNPETVNTDSVGSHSEEQPDSEPENPTASDVNNHPEMVPIPNEPFSDHEEESSLFCTQYDHWKVEGQHLVRYHNELRNRMFCPSNVSDCPIPLSRLSEKRQTFVQPIHGEGWTLEDTWNDVTSQQILPMPWTGKTIIPIRVSEEFKVDDIDTYQAYQDCDSFVGYEIALTLEHHEIKHCSKINYDEQIAFLASAAKRQRAEVKEKNLSESDRQLFLGAKHKEVTSWLSTETVRKIARSKIPEEQILRSRWVLTWKPIDNSGTESEGNQYKPKARLVILGFEDPHIETLSRDAPTMGKDSRMLILQYIASARWSLRSFDIQTAFLRGSRQDGRILGMEPPPEMRQQMDLKPWECCELLKSAYGLVNAPLLWYEELKTSLIQLGFIVSPLDPCVFVLPNTKEGKIHGVVGVHVDDGIGAGDAYFQHCIAQLEQKFPFGSKKEGCFMFTGIQITQKTDGSIELDQKKYIEDIPAIEIPRERRKFPEASVSEQERQSLRGVIGSIQYGATNTRPDLSAKLSFLQAKITVAKVQDLLEANKLLHEAKSHKETKITIKSIPLNDLRFVSFSDASFATRANSQSQKGCLIMAASWQIGNWQSSEASPLIWYSKKISRVVASTLASEAYALSGSVDLLTWVRLHWSWICKPHDQWKQPESCLQQCPEAYAVVDCKSLYDLIQKTTIPSCQEYRTMLEALIIKDRIKEGIVIKWVHSAAQLADSLTKCMDNSTLRQFLAAGRCIIHDVDEILKVRADNRARKQWRDHQWTPNDQSHVKKISSLKKT